MYIDDAYYFISAHTYKKMNLLINSGLKSILKTIIDEIFLSYGYNLLGWVILPDHYHLLFKSKTGEALSEVVRKIHSKSTVQVNKTIEKTGKIWYNYWDSCIRDERSFYMHSNYIHMNPVKHGLVKSPGDYGFSSYSEYLKRNGEQWISDTFREYPIIDFLKFDD